ncbi:hypothetical protein BGZ70_001396, partial [Mortierella alpina]
HNAYGKESYRKSLPAKTRQSSGAIIPQVPYSWVQSQQSQQSEQLDPQQQQQQQQQQQFEYNTKNSVSSSSRQSFRDSEHQHQDHQQQQQQHQQQYQQEDAFRQQYYQQQFLQQQTPSTGSAGAMEVAQYRTPLQPQGSASPHRRGMSASSDIPMSPNPPMTPSSMSTSEGSPLTAVTSPLSSGRSSSGLYSQYQKPSAQAPPSPASHSHYRSKSYSSGPIPLTIPLESSPKSAGRGSNDAVSKHHSTHGSLTPSKKVTSAESTTQPRDLYRRSESYSTLQSRLQPSTTHPVPSTSGALEAHSRTSSLTSTQQQDMLLDAGTNADQTPNKRDSWREQEQYLLQLQQRDHQTRAKLKRESFYAAFQNNNNTNNTSNSGSGSNNNLGGNQEESKHYSRTPSRPASPHLPSGIPQLRTKSRSGVLSTPTADYKGRPTPPPRSRSRTPAGSAGGVVPATNSAPQQPQVPQQYSGELQSILRKSVIASEETAAPSQRPDSHHRSPSSSTPTSKAGTPLPQTADTIPVPVADMTKHMSALDLREVAPKVALTPVEQPLSTVTPRQAPVTNLTNPNRRSIVFDIPTTPVRGNGTAHGAESSVGKMKDVGVAISGTKERTSIFASGSNNVQSITRKRGKYFT